MEGIREKAAWASVIALSLLLIGALAGVVRGGPLDPTGPPGSTGKTVITSLPFTISQPGSYVLNGNLTDNSGDGITILASDVTIDLNGFTLFGQAGAFSGISEGGTPTPRKHWTIRNGTIDGFPFSGIYAFDVSDSTFENLTLTNNAGDPAITARDGVTIRNMTVDNTGNYGIKLGDRGIIQNCHIEVSAPSSWAIDIGHESLVDGCNVFGNHAAGGGIRVTDSSVVRNCVAADFKVIGIQVTAATVTGCSVYDILGPSMAIGIQAVLSVVDSNTISGVECFSGSGCPNQAQGIIAATGGGNRIRNNHIFQILTENGAAPAYAISIISTHNTVSGNSFTQAASGIGCTLAPNDCAPTGQASTSTNPWLNVSY
ncbi:MAG TPA: right-handed parallel beta-helix repeat-containing protein [Dehalococcoidia bacterium]|nr:right-handed parallel beta-helix repeat-containing protein [Dehalococcoidia bacterium]